MDTQNELTPGPHNCMTMGLHACQYCTCQSDFDQHNITHSTACMNGEDDNSRFVSMHVYMHLAFKELKYRLGVLWMAQKSDWFLLGSLQHVLCMGFQTRE